MAVQRRIPFTIVLVLICKESLSVPLRDMENNQLPIEEQSHKLKFLPIHGARQPRAENENQSGSGNLGETIANVIKDGAAAGAAIESPTMIVGGFSLMMQPMPNGGELAGQLMQMAPNFLNLIPGTG